MEGKGCGEGPSQILPMHPLTSRLTRPKRYENPTDVALIAEAEASMGDFKLA